MNSGDGSLEPVEVLEISDLATLKVMADPQRMRIVDLLRRKAATVKEIAAELQAPPKSLYYHVNLLEKHGLIRVVETRMVSGIAEKRYRATAHLFNFSEMEAPPGTPHERVALDAFVSLLSITQDEMRISLESGLVHKDQQEGDNAQTHLEWDLIDLSEAEAQELAGKLHALLTELRERGDDTSPRTPHRVMTLLFPTYRRGERPDSPR